MNREECENRIFTLANRMRSVAAEYTGGDFPISAYLNTGGAINFICQADSGKHISIWQNDKYPLEFSIDAELAACQQEILSLMRKIKTVAGEYMEREPEYIAIDYSDSYGTISYNNTYWKEDADKPLDAGRHVKYITEGENMEHPDITKGENMEHPDITKANNTGYPHDEPDTYHCPVCGEELNYYAKIYKKCGEIIGCGFCVEAITVEDLN